MESHLGFLQFGVQLFDVSERLGFLLEVHWLHIICMSPCPPWLPLLSQVPIFLAHDTETLIRSLLPTLPSVLEAPPWPHLVECQALAVANCISTLTTSIHPTGDLTTPSAVSTVSGSRGFYPHTGQWHGWLLPMEMKYCSQYSYYRNHVQSDCI